MDIADWAADEPSVADANVIEVLATNRLEWFFKPV